MLKKAFYPFRFILRYRIKVIHPERLPQDTPFIIAANHQSYLDPMTSWLAVARYANRQTYFIAKHQLKPFFGRFGSWLGMMYINPQDKARILETARQHLAQGFCIGIFPEGMRNNYHSTELLKAKTGAARLALTCDVPVVPAGIIAPAGLTAVEAFKNFFRPSREYSITIGEPLRFKQVLLEKISHDDLEKTSREIMYAVGTLCNKKYSF